MELVDDHTLNVAAETEYVADLINARTEDFNKIEELMSDLNQMAIQVNENTAKQGEVLVEVD